MFAPILVSEQGFFPQEIQCLMHVIRSGNSYNISNNLPQLQAQITQLTSILEQINHRIDVTDEHRARDEFGPQIGGCVGLL
jgi:hypothetical protein